MAPSWVTPGVACVRPPVGWTNSYLAGILPVNTFLALAAGSWKPANLVTSRVSLFLGHLIHRCLFRSLIYRVLCNQLERNKAMEDLLNLWSLIFMCYVTLRLAIWIVKMMVYALEVDDGCTCPLCSPPPYRSARRKDVEVKTEWIEEIHLTLFGILFFGGCGELDCPLCYSRSWRCVRRYKIKDKEKKTS